jgi:hypothetical protein
MDIVVPPMRDAVGDHRLAGAGERAVGILGMSTSVGQSCRPSSATIGASPAAAVPAGAMAAMRSPSISKSTSSAPSTSPGGASSGAASRQAGTRAPRSQ